MKNYYSFISKSDDSAEKLIFRLEKEFSLQWYDNGGCIIEQITNAHINGQTIALTFFPHHETCQWLKIHIYGVATMKCYKARLDLSNSLRANPFCPVIVLYIKGKVVLTYLKL